MSNILNRDESIEQNIEDFNAESVDPVPNDEVKTINTNDAEGITDEVNQSTNTDSFEEVSQDSSQESKSKTNVVEQKKIKSYWDRCILYWSQFKNPSVWICMVVFLLIGGAFWCLGFIPDFESAMLSQSIFAIIGGVLLGIIPQVQTFIHRQDVHPGVAFSKTTYMQLAVILYGFRVKLEDIAEIGWSGAFTAILMVIFTFAFACGIGYLMKIPATQGGILACGFSICGIAAILSSCQLFESSPSEISLACVFVIVGGFLDIIIYPIVYSCRTLFGFTEKTFAINAGISIKEIAHTVSVGLSCSAEVSKYAMIVKMFKVFCLPFLLIILGFALPIIRKRAENKKAQHTIDENQEETLYMKCTEFWGKVSIPYFALMFIILTAINSSVHFPEKVVEIMNQVIIIFLSASMFGVGVTTDLRELFRGANWRPAVLAFILYVWVFGFSWFLTWVFSRFDNSNQE